MTPRPDPIRVDRDLALNIVIHLLRFELRRPMLLDILAPLFEKYAFSDADRKMVEATIWSYSFFTQYLDEYDVPPENRAEVRAHLLEETMVVMGRLRRAAAQMKVLTSQLPDLPSSAKDASDDKANG